VIEVGPGKHYETLYVAIRAASPGDTLRLTPGEHFDCARVDKDRLTIEGSGAPEDTQLTDKPCDGKAALVTTGSDITVRNLTLTRIRVPDGNGAGIRMEGTNLTVDHVRFVNNQDGILTSNNLDSTLIVRDSEFLRNGACNPDCAHGIYANHLKLVHIERTKFFETKTAHHIKSRALRTEVIDCDIQDGANGTASYEIELPNGGALLARGNVFQKGPLSDNHTAAIMVGSEGVNQPTREIRVENNSFKRDGSYPTVLLYNMTATEAELVGNKVGPGIKQLNGDGAVR
jgi:hypothetical protein